MDRFVWHNTGQSPNDASEKNAIHFLKSMVHMLEENVQEGEQQPETLKGHLKNHSLITLSTSRQC